MKQADYLNVRATDRESLEKYRETLVSKYRVEEHDSVIRLLKSKEFIDDNLAVLTTKSIDAKLLTNKFQKAKLLKEFDAKFGINLFNLDEDGEDIKMDDGFFNLVCQTFRMKRAKPTNHCETKQLFVAMVRSATCKALITSKQAKCKKDRDKPLYTLDESILKYHLELNGLKNKKRRGFAPEVVEKFGLEEPLEEFDQFLEDVEALDA